MKEQHNRRDRNLVDKLLRIWEPQKEGNQRPQKPVPLCGRNSRPRKDTLDWLDGLGIRVDLGTYASLLGQYGDAKALLAGKRVHSHIVKSEREQDRFLGNLLVLMYGKCGALGDASTVFAKMRQHNVFSWNIIIGAYAHYDKGKEALRFYQQMLLEGVLPDKVTFVSILSACSDQVALGDGRQIHGLVMGCEFESDVSIGTALVNMYRKCGTLAHARKVFDEMAERNVMSWSAIIAAHGQHGEGKEALGLFQKMEREGVIPNDITFVSILSACSHTGLVDEGCRYFMSMINDHGITPNEEHYNCMIDLLGRAGRLSEGEELMENFKPSAMSWITLLSACRMTLDLERAKCAAEHVHDLDPRNSKPYTLLSNIYSAAGRWRS